jgi:hypothetical protein
LKLPVAPNNGDHHFSKLFNVEETKGIIHSRIYPACDVVQSVWYNISALICVHMLFSFLSPMLSYFPVFFVVTGRCVDKDSPDR